MAAAREIWGSRLGVILAVAGSAVGLGNFLRFPGLVAEYGGGPFMLAYFTALLLIGIPICWAEWALGKQGGLRGFHSSPGIFWALRRRPWAKYLGLLGVLVPVSVFTYYVLIEAWCLGYAWHALTGNLTAPGADSRALFATFTGIKEDGAALHFGVEAVGFWLIIVFLLNYWFIYRGISKGIERLCLVAMPLLIVLAMVILVRVLTLGTPDPLKPEQSVLAGLGRMWNPGDWSRLADPQLWLAACGQIFFTLSVGFGAIITYASYLHPKDDVVLGGLTATAANEFCEVGLGGMITVPAAFVFFGAAGVAGGTFGLGFNVLPEVFARMPFGGAFAFAFFFLLFLAAITSSLSMLQPGIAFLEEGFGLKRKASVAVLGFVTAAGTLFIWYFSKDLKALDTVDFWLGTVGLFVQGTIVIIFFGWIYGIDRGWRAAHAGAEMRIPEIWRPVMRWITPAFLVGVFGLFLLRNVFGWNFSFAAPQFAPTGYVTDLLPSEGSSVARVTVLFYLILGLFTALLVHLAGKRWEPQAAELEARERAAGIEPGGGKEPSR